MHYRKPYVDVEVLKAMQSAHAAGYETVFASYLLAWLDIDRDERSVKRDLRRLAQAGVIRHIGRRGGYRLERRSND